jgi:DNA-binding NarL/FixJ family response regulator
VTIVQALADGRDRKSIAYSLGLSEPMITYEIRHAAELAKVRRSAAALVAKALRAGWMQ